MNATNSGNVEKFDDLNPKYLPHDESLNVSVKFLRIWLPNMKTTGKWPLWLNNTWMMISPTNAFPIIIPLFQLFFSVLPWKCPNAPKSKNGCVLKFISHFLNMNAFRIFSQNAPKSASGGILRQTGHFLDMNNISMFFLSKITLTYQV